LHTPHTDKDARHDRVVHIFFPFCEIRSPLALTLGFCG
jgi:hypothetical protein